MRPIVNVEVIVAVQLQLIEFHHESLKYTVCLEGNGAIEGPLVLRREDSPLDLPVDHFERAFFSCAKKTAKRCNDVESL